MLHIDNLSYLRTTLLAEKNKLTKDLGDPPAKTLFGRIRRNGTYQLYFRDYSAQNSKEIYVNSDRRQEAVQIAKFMATQEKINDLNIQIEAIDSFLEAFSSATSFDTLARNHPWILKLLDTTDDVPDKLQQWKTMDYERNWNYPENLKYRTVVPDLVVRSKSESDIVSRLENFDVPYHYDEVININGTRINMDFVCLNVNSGQKWYWDHRGMMSNPSYIEKALFCEKVYLNAGIIPGVNLILTNETSSHPLQIPDIDEMIRYYLL